MKNPLVHTGRGYYRVPTSGSDAANFSSSQSTAHDVNLEEDLRHRLRILDDDIDELLEKRKGLWHSIQIHQEKRFAENVKWWKQRYAHAKVLEAEEAAKQEAERAQQELQRQLEVEAQRKRERTCNHCRREFVNPAAMRNHVKDVHALSCPECGKRFRSWDGLHQHIHDTGHDY